VALSDGQQQIDFAGFAQLMRELQPLLNAVGRTI
jgi:3-deoxy-D-arabino-heptulosonate 7-phosphate (DAHP) synthase